MIYLSNEDIDALGINWSECIAVIADCIKCYHADKCVQPIKPYLRFGNPANRIIAMPAYVGGNIDVAGIKWIASFPDNIKSGLPRATSIVILNDARTGQIVSIINTSFLSAIRTVSVSALVLKAFLEARPTESITIGIIGLGPIGQLHLIMCRELCAERNLEFTVYDINKSLCETVGTRTNSIVAKEWRDAYCDADVVITSTVSTHPYINREPKRGALLLNISLRDYQTSVYRYVANAIIVDDWDEVCRENTDIQKFHEEMGLNRQHTKSLLDLVIDDCLKKYPPDAPVMFNPMGLAMFDIAIASYYTQMAQAKGFGLRLS